jgi:glutathione peroxidase
MNIFSFFNTSSTVNDPINNAYDFSFTKLNSSDQLSLGEFKGQVIMIVNTASKCGFTKQYEGLEKLYQKFKDRGFVIIGVPSDDFGGQELNNEEEIQQFCQINYGVTFPLTNKTKVKGKDRHPFFHWAHKVLGMGTAPKWNFHKYLINRDGKLIDYFHSTTTPESNKIIDKLNELI